MDILAGLLVVCWRTGGEALDFLHCSEQENPDVEGRSMGERRQLTQTYTCWIIQHCGIDRVLGRRKSDSSFCFDQLLFPRAA